MNEKEILEGNELIVEFMKFDKVGPNVDGQIYHCIINDFNSLLIPKTMEFHSSWDWLMPVVEKISDVCKPSSDSHYYWNSKTDIRIFRETKEVTYKAVIEFIKWYNKNKK